jgi:hypothetical protein
MRLGVLTSGGDCPGLNAVVRSVVHRAVAHHGDEVVGFHDGWRGLMEGDFRPLGLDAVGGILARGGTVLGASHVRPATVLTGAGRAKAQVSALGLDAVIPIGGEGTLKAAYLLAGAGLSVVAVPKTIGNEIPATDMTFGSDTAVGVATAALDRLATTAESDRACSPSRSWAAARAGSPCARGWLPARTSSPCPSGLSASTTSPPASGGTSRPVSASPSPSSSSPRAPHRRSGPVFRPPGHAPVL